MNGWVLARAAPAICKQSAGATDAHIIIAMKAYVIVSFLNRLFKWRSFVSDRQWRSLKVASGKWQVASLVSFLGLEVIWG